VVYLEVYSHFLATSGPASKAAERKLWAALLAYVAAETVVTVTDFHDSFRKNYEIMNNFLGLNFGLDDINPKGLDLDSALAQSMLSFYHDILAFDDSFSDERARMVQKAWDMVGYDDEFLVCLKQLVGPTLAKVWHPFIRDLGQTRGVYQSAVFLESSPQSSHPQTNQNDPGSSSLPKSAAIIVTQRSAGCQEGPFPYILDPFANAIPTSRDRTDPGISNCYATCDSHVVTFISSSHSAFCSPKHIPS
jgi:hypothetical protein